jgi:hypothetical protein
LFETTIFSFRRGDAHHHWKLPWPTNPSQILRRAKLLPREEAQLDHHTCGKDRIYLEGTFSATIRIIDTPGWIIFDPAAEK